MSLKPCCATGSLHTGTPTGRIEKVHGLDCYIADAPNDSPKGVVVIIPDAFGWTLPNNRILADCYAKEGNFQVYLPEFMNGEKPLNGRPKEEHDLIVNFRYRTPTRPHGFNQSFFCDWLHEPAQKSWPRNVPCVSFPTFHVFLPSCRYWT